MDPAEDVGSAMRMIVASSIPIVVFDKTTDL
jgi:hypothetical protein